MVVVVDPGHGGNDPGAVGPSGLHEKDVNLAIARHAANYLLSCGVEVILTRNTDTDVSLAERVDIANRAGAVVFLSIHVNSGGYTATGAETYYHHGSAEGKRLAVCVQEQMTALGLYNRGVKDDTSLYSGGLYVLRETAMPAALVEVAFISNPNEEAWLANPDNQDAAGKAIAKGVCEYLGVPFVEGKQEPKPSFPSGSSSSDGGSGDSQPGGWADEALRKLAEKARFNTPHDAGEPVTMGMLAVVLDRLGLLD